MLITNTDNQIIQETERTIGVKFDEIITAEQVHAYKPSHKGFLLAREGLGLQVSEIWHRYQHNTNHAILEYIFQ